MSVEEIPRIKRPYNKKPKGDLITLLPKPKIIKQDILPRENLGGAIIQLLWQQKLLHPSSELEFRLGKFDQQTKRFNTGVSAEYFESLLQLVRAEKSYNTQLSGYDGQNKDDWDMNEVMYYPNSIRSSKPNEYEEVSRLNKLDMISQNGLYDIRFSLKKENKLSPDQIKKNKSLKQATSCRYKTRQSYIYPQHGFRIDFTLAVSIPIYTNNYQSVKQTKTYEIELEVIAEIIDYQLIYNQILRLLGQDLHVMLTPVLI